MMGMASCFSWLVNKRAAYVIARVGRYFFQLIASHPAYSFEMITSQDAIERRQTRPSHDNRKLIRRSRDVWATTDWATDIRSTLARRLDDMRWMFVTFHSPFPFSFPFLPSLHASIPVPFPTLRFPPFPFQPLPLGSTAPLIQLRSLGERCKLPAGHGRQMVFAAFSNENLASRDCSETDFSLAYMQGLSTS